MSAEFGIRVCVIEPGFIRTDIVEHSPVAATLIVEPYISARSNPSRILTQPIEQDSTDLHMVGPRTVVQAATEQYPRLRSFPTETPAWPRCLVPSFPLPISDFAFSKQLHMNED